MSTDLVVTLVMGIFVVLLVLETPIAYVLGAAGVTGILLLRDADLATSKLGSLPYSDLANYSLAIIPMYILLGMFALHGRLAERVYSLASIALRRLPGGLGIATVAACAGFAAVCGSSVATAASLGRISVQEMTKAGYKESFAGGIVAISGTLGILIPPSVPMVLYGVVAKESISQLLMAGVVPGVLSGIAYAAYIAFRAKKDIIPVAGGSLKPALAAAGHGQHIGGALDDAAAMAGTGAESVLLPEKPQDPDEITNFQRARGMLWLGLIFMVILLGILTGTLTVMESAAIAALIAMVMLLAENAREGLRAVGRRFGDAVLEAASISAMAFALLVGAGIFSTFLVMARVPVRLAEWTVGLDMPGWLVVVLILVILIPLGMFLESLSIVIIVAPLVHPVVTDLGFDGVWFAVLFVMMLEIGLVTPPVGMNVFVVSMSARLPLEQVFRGVFPFLSVSFALVALVFLIPEIATWLPAQLQE